MDSAARATELSQHEREASAARGSVGMRDSGYARGREALLAATVEAIDGAKLEPLLEAAEDWF